MDGAHMYKLWSKLVRDESEREVVERRERRNGYREHYDALKELIEQI